jgi:hypothetical protein
VRSSLKEEKSYLYFAIPKDHLGSFVTVTEFLIFLLLDSKETSFNCLLFWIQCALSPFSVANNTISQFGKF